MLQIALARTASPERPPVVLTLHEGESFLPRGARDPDADLVKRLVYSKRIKRWAAGLADCVVTVAPGLDEAISLSRPSVVIPPGVDIDRFRPMGSDACRATLGLPRDRPVVFSMSPTETNMGYSVFTQAVSLASPVHVVTGGESIRAPFMNAADCRQVVRYEASPMVVKEARVQPAIVSTDVVT
jgi:glycosyltransferase involved in cell wall biosynthesis